MLRKVVALINASRVAAWRAPTGHTKASAAESMIRNLLVCLIRPLFCLERAWTASGYRSGAELLLSTVTGRSLVVEFPWLSAAYTRTV